MRPRLDGETSGPGPRVPGLLLWPALRFLVDRSHRRGPELHPVRHRRGAAEAGHARALDSRSPLLVPRRVDTPRRQAKLLDYLRVPPDPGLGRLVDEGEGRVSHVIYGDGRAALADRATPGARDGRAMAHRGRADIRHLSGATAV